MRDLSQEKGLYMNPLVSRFMKLNMTFFRKSCSNFAQLNSIDTEGLRASIALYENKSGSNDPSLKRLEAFD